MTIREQTSRATNSPAVPSSDDSAASTASPVPLRSRDSGSEPALLDAAAEVEGGNGGGNGVDRSFSKPKLRLDIRDLGHPGAAKFLGTVNAGTVLSAAVENVLRLLYRSPSDQHTTVPPTRSVTLVLRDMDGVAYTTGTELDEDHKEIHFSLNYINSIKPPSRLTAEITGVLTHELVHCYQWDAKGSCPGGLIEGIADWVRLNCDLSPPHWKRETEGDWDRGYQHTAYFLQYLELRFGEGTIRRLNDKLRSHKYKAESFWPELLGKPVERLYGDYVDKLKDDCA
ncbi:Peptidase of plants and bacteria-domain-containing protein [Madurella fahalii]|uniref:Peptidase of plants and bacteria-domain-containing protein n=1 Tax=Madurella fahalii TaxID=1157608 RepID=A0ABQ0GML6_9PEZI